MQKHILHFDESKDLLVSYTIEPTDEIAAYTEYLVTLYVNGEETFSEKVLSEDMDFAHRHAETMYEDYKEYIKS
jgi:hypothetical protein